MRQKVFIVLFFLAGYCNNACGQFLLKELPGSATLQQLKKLRIPLECNKNNNVAMKPTDIQSRFVAYYSLSYDGLSGLKPNSDSIRYYIENGMPGFKYQYVESTLFGLSIPASFILTPTSDINDMLPQSIDSIISYKWDTVVNAFSDVNIRSITYEDATGMISSIVTQTRNESGYENSTKKIYTYNQSGLITGIISQNWINMNWENGHQSLLTYDIDGNVIEDIEQNWNVSNNLWDNYTKSTYVYNSDEKIISRSFQFWPGGQWVNSAKRIYEYTGEKLTSITYQTGSVNTWTNNEKIIYSYNGNNRIMDLLESWSDTGWNDIMRYTYTYENDKCTDYIEQFWADSGWQNETKVSVMYDDDHVSIIVYKKWHIGDWQNDSRITINRNEYYQITNFYSEYWNADGFWEYTNNSDGAKLFYETYDNGTSVGEINKPLTFKLFPNPTNSILHIESEDNSIKMVKIFDNTGRVILSTHSHNTTNVKSIDISNLVSGIYILQAYTENAVGSMKLVVK